MPETNVNTKGKISSLDNRPKIQLDNEEIRKIEVVKELAGIRSRNAVIRLALRLLFTKYGIF